MDKFEEFSASIKNKKKITLEEYCEGNKNYPMTINFILNRNKKIYGEN